MDAAAVANIAEALVREYLRVHGLEASFAAFEAERPRGPVWARPAPPQRGWAGGLEGGCGLRGFAPRRRGPPVAAARRPAAEGVADEPVQTPGGAGHATCTRRGRAGVPLGKLHSGGLPSWRPASTPVPRKADAINPHAPASRLAAGAHACAAGTACVPPAPAAHVAPARAAAGRAERRLAPQWRRRSWRDGAHRLIGPLGAAAAAGHASVHAAPLGRAGRQPRGAGGRQRQRAAGGGRVGGAAAILAGKRVCA